MMMMMMVNHPNNKIQTSSANKGLLGFLVTLASILIILLVLATRLRTNSSSSCNYNSSSSSSSSSQEEEVNMLLPSPLQQHHRGDKNKTTKIPSITIGIDVHGLPVNMPLMGAGSWQYNDTIAYQSFCKAFEEGIQLIDTAFGYGNQKGVGRAIRDCYNGRRQDLFVLTKVPGGLSHSETLTAHRQNMWELNLGYVDHLMTHYPADWEATKASKQQRQDEWMALEEIYYTGGARSIGISHYCSRHIDDILEIATVTPSLNQVEYHVGSGDVNHVIQKCKDSNITFMSYSPLCGPCQHEPQDSLIDGTLVTSIAKKYDKNITGSQVSLRFIVQQALMSGSFIGGVIPKSNNVQHLRLNRDIFDFELSQQDMDKLFSATKPAAQKGDCNVP